MRSHKRRMLQHVSLHLDPKLSISVGVSVAALMIRKRKKMMMRRRKMMIMRKKRNDWDDQKIS